MLTIRKVQDKFRFDSAFEILGIDYRSLALLRVALSIILIIDLCMRLTDLTAHYTDAGVLQRFDEVTAITRQFFVSFHLHWRRSSPTRSLFRPFLETKINDYLLLFK